MGSLYKDLDKFLKTDGIRIVMESGCVRTEPLELLTPADIGSFDSMDLKSMDRDKVKCLLDQLEDLLDTLEEEEPEAEDSAAYKQWKEQVSATEDFMNEVQDCLDRLDEESVPGGGRVERIKLI